MALLRWGVAGAGRISHDFVTAVNNPDGPAVFVCKVIAVASLNRDRATEFAAKHDIGTVHGSYEELANNQEIDVVYIGNTTGLHYDTCKMMLNAGKHVLCEKSLSTSAIKAKELFDLAAFNHLFLMEAVWSNFLPIYKRMNVSLRDEAVGPVTYMEASLGIPLPRLACPSQRDVAGGAAHDLGIYLVNLVRLMFNNEQPEEIIARGRHFPSGLDAGWDAILVFSSSRRAVLKCSAEHLLSNVARICGPFGWMELSEPFCCPDRITYESGEISEPFPKGSLHAYNFTNASGLVYEAVAVSEALMKGKLECDEYTSTDSLYVAGILDSILKQVADNLDTAT